MDVSELNTAWQGHKYSESIDSEVSFFDPSTSATTRDSWSGYFEGWEGPSRDSYCPEIASASSSPTRSHRAEDETPVHHPELLPTACPRRSRPTSTRRDTAAERYDPSPLVTPMKAPGRKKRYGMVPYADPHAGDEAVSQLNNLLHNTMANTEDILGAMYSSNWDAASLQRWYSQSARGPSDLALYKIMFSLHYSTADTPSV